MDFFNASNISAYSSLILVIATIVYVSFTYKLFKETKKLREVETSPFMSLELCTFRSSLMLSLKIRNIGKAPAYKISFDIDEKFKDIFRFNFQNTISYFSPQQEIEALGKYYKEFLELNIDNIPIKVTYFSKEGIKYEDTFLLEWKYLDGVVLEENILSKIEKNLNNISKELENQNNLTKNKNQIISRLSILEINKTDFYFTCLFNNGYLGRIEKNKIETLGLNDIDKVELSNNNLHDRSINMLFTSEEIYNIFLKIEKNKITYKKKNIKV